MDAAHIIVDILDEHEEILRLEDSFESAFMSSEMEKKWRKLPRNLSLIYLGESHSFYILIVNDLSEI